MALQPFVPHFDFPMRYNPVNHTFWAMEQDSLDDIFNCVHVTVRTRPGQRQMQPEFGVDDVTFSQQAVDISGVADDVRRWEPRSDIAWESRMDQVDTMIARIRAEIRAAH